jgi:hypothetical protein
VPVPDTAADRWSPVRRDPLKAKGNDTRDRSLPALVLRLFESRAELYGPYSSAEARPGGSPVAGS